MGLRLALAFVVSNMAGCGVTLHVGRPPEMAGRDTLEVSQRSADRCVHGASGRDSLYRLELPGPVTDPALVAAVGQFSASVRRTAVAAGLEPLLAQIVIERDRSMQRGAPTPELLAMRDELAARMYTLETQRDQLLDALGRLAMVSEDALRHRDDRELDVVRALRSCGPHRGGTSADVVGEHVFPFRAELRRRYST